MYDAIYDGVCSGDAGSRTITRLKIFPRRGDSPLEGVGFDHQRATYYWDPVSKLKNYITKFSKLLCISGFSRDVPDFVLLSAQI